MSQEAFLFDDTLKNNITLYQDGYSDDMIMKGVQDYGTLEAVIVGIKAGLDMFIFRNSDSETLGMIEKLCSIVEQDEDLKKRVLDSNKRIAKLKNKLV